MPQWGRGFSTWWVRWRGATGWQLEQQLEQRAVRREPEQWPDELEQQHRLSLCLPFGRGARLEMTNRATAMLTDGIVVRALKALQAFVLG